MPDLSIIIPCYNSGHFLPEAVESIQLYKGVHSMEVILVDDGSTDTCTKRYLQCCKELYNYRVIHQPNAGPAAARNTGVENATAAYILFLDSDNRINAQPFIDKGIALLDSNNEIGVFYGNPSFFGQITVERLFTSKAFDFETMLSENYIDICSIVRRATWKEVGGLDENKLLMGHEDWDFWLRIGTTKWKFHHEDQTLFEYRITVNSLVSQSTHSQHYDNMVRYIYQKHSTVLPQHLKDWCNKFET